MKEYLLKYSGFTMLYSFQMYSKVIQLYIYICVCIYIYIRIFMYVCICVYIYVCVCVCVCVCIYIYFRFFPLIGYYKILSTFPWAIQWVFVDYLFYIWLKYWSFSFSISLSNEYSGVISFRDWLVWSPIYVHPKLLIYPLPPCPKSL